MWTTGAPDPRGTVVVFHGGSWRSGTSRFEADAICADLTRHGWSAANVEYRRLGGGGGWPATFDDAAAALLLVRGLAVADAGPVVALGHSAGGTLALWLASRAVPGGAGDGLAGAISMAGVAGLARAARAGVPVGAVVELMGGTPDEVPDRYARADPEATLPAPVPVALVHGTEDATVPLDSSRGYVAAAQAAQGQALLVAVDGADHGGFLRPRSVGWGATRDALDHWG